MEGHGKGWGRDREGGEDRPLASQPQVATAVPAANERSSQLCGQAHRFAAALCRLLPPAPINQPTSNSPHQTASIDQPPSTSISQTPIHQSLSTSPPSTNQHLTANHFQIQMRICYAGAVCEAGACHGQGAGRDRPHTSQEGGGGVQRRWGSVWGCRGWYWL